MGYRAVRQGGSSGASNGGQRGWMNGAGLRRAAHTPPLVARHRCHGADRLRVPRPEATVPAGWAAAAASRTAVTLGGNFLWSVPHLAEAFTATHPRITLQPMRNPSPLPPDINAALTVLPAAAVTGYQGGPLVPLDAALRSVNFNTTATLPGMLDAFTVRGAIRGLPFWLSPLAVRWRRDVFAAARLPTPAAGWTFGDCQQACADIAVLAPPGKVPGLVAPLPPMVDMGLHHPPQNPVGDPLVWMAFVLGFGGNVVTDGAFGFDAGAQAGLAALVDLARRFGAEPAKIPHATDAEVTAMPEAFALTFERWQAPDRQATCWPAVPPLEPVTHALLGALNTPAPLPAPL